MTSALPQVVHPILDQRFYLDVTHKIRLKEEFSKLYVLASHSFVGSIVDWLNFPPFFPDIEPWTFEQNLGEAVMIPAGCPYQIRKLKVIFEHLNGNSILLFSVCMRVHVHLHGACIEVIQHCNEIDPFFKPEIN